MTYVLTLGRMGEKLGRTAMSRVKERSTPTGKAQKTKSVEDGRKLDIRLNLKTLRRNLNLSQEGLSRLLGISTRTLARWEVNQTKLSSSALIQLKKLEEIEELLQKIYTPEGIKEFLASPIGENGDTPADAIRKGRHDLVLDLLAADYEGMGY